MNGLGGIGVAGGVALAALAVMLAPATAASVQPKERAATRAPSLNAGGFTPAVADPRLAAEFARRGFPSGSFRFTPSAASPDKSKAVRVAVRARSTTSAQALRPSQDASAGAITAITPTAYNLGVSVGWKRFALSGDVARLQGGPLPGDREAAEVGLSYTGKNFTGRLQLGAERTENQPVMIGEESSYSLDVGGSYKIARNLDLTGGVRYRIQNDRLGPLADDRRDSQAVYVGTAFRF